ncbi:related to Phospholipase/Carboxylesterase superfamily [Cephalotrichum gorgonifer]|uniref:Related to Phospholipase/Carboxylesterase superfamily n=1 Tax=Cephalotrichum gorgonifer TaxID=2041049 RepID=A0AAE8SS60_9PEZI|nr:related to Phospholipase/Carboxylesterase superfamily [Cephalotrichum gorgonifer]
MPPRIPTEEDLTSLPLPLSVHFPSPPESTTAILVLLHGFGDSAASFINFARNMELPGVLTVAVRGTAPLPPSILPPGADEDRHFHWGDDVQIDQSTGDIAADPGFEKAVSPIMDVLIKGCLVEKFGWEPEDVILFGFGQGGSLALGLASRFANPRVVDVEGGAEGGKFKGVVSVGGPLPPSMVSTLSGRRKSKTKALIVQVRGADKDYVEEEFESVKSVEWKREEVDTPRNREEMYPIMAFLGELLGEPQPVFGQI